MRPRGAAKMPPPKRPGPANERSEPPFVRDCGETNVNMVAAQSPRECLLCCNVERQAASGKFRDAILVLLASGLIIMRMSDGWQSLAGPRSNQIIELAA
jgi:hypothetical protein